MSVEQPFGPTSTDEWAQSEPAGDASAPDEVGADDSSLAVASDDGGAVVEDDGGTDLPVEERVRRQVAALDGIADLPLSEHARRYDEVHAELQAALTEIDGESG